MNRVATPDSQYIVVDNVTMHYQVLGANADLPVIIFTHGGGPGSTAWSNFHQSAPSFAKHFRCIYVDLPQFGQSEAVPIAGAVFTWYAKKLKGFMDALGIGHAHFVNQSFGGCVATRFAADFPEYVNRLVMIGSQPVSKGVLTPLPLFSKHASHLMADYYVNNGGPTKDKMRALIQRYELYNDEAVDEETVSLRFDASIQSGFAELMKNPSAFGEWEDLTAIFCRVTAPTLICWGLHDWFGGVDVPMLMVNQFTDARLHVVPNAAHHLQSEKPLEFYETVDAFLRSQAR